jgi:hypothetical protein
MARFRGPDDGEPSTQKLSNFILAIRKTRNEIETITGRKNPNRDLEPLSTVHELRLKKIHRNCKKKGKPTQRAIEQRYNTILGLRRKGVSWRDIEQYLRRYCGLSASYSYVRRTFKEINKNNQL